MQNKIIAIMAAVLAIVAGCKEQDTPYAPKYLNTLTVQAVYPEGVPVRGGATLTVTEVTGAVQFVKITEEDGTSVLFVPDGIYRITLRDQDLEHDVIYNASKDKIPICNQNLDLPVELKAIKPGKIIIKEIYNGGCDKAPQEGTYQADQYILIHNNGEDAYYLDGLCMASVYPYNATGENHLLGPGGTLPDYVPLAQAVLMMPGKGEDFPLEGGADALIALRGAIDHTQEYPLSVNLNRADAFVLYDPVLFPNTSYHPSPGTLIDPTRYLEVVVKQGSGNAYILSVTSPAFVIFRPEEGVDIHAWVMNAENRPEAKSEKLVAIPPEWVLDGVEVFDGSRSGNQKRLLETIDAGFITLTENFKSHTLMRRGEGKLQDSNNSTEDFYERETQSLRQ